MKKMTVTGIIAAGGLLAALLKLTLPYTAAVERVDGTITRVTDRVAGMYLVRTPEGYVAVDTGSNPEAVKRGLKAAGIEPEKVRAVFLTHSDADHVAGLVLFATAAVYLPEDEVRMINGSTGRFACLPFLKNSLGGRAYTTLSDNEEITFGGTVVRTIFLPGHTAGSAGYIVDGKYFFTGDALNLEEGRVRPFTAVLTMDMDAMKDSIRKIADFQGIRYLFTAHSGYTGEYRAAMSDWKNPGTTDP